MSHGQAHAQLQSSCKPPKHPAFRTESSFEPLSLCYARQAHHQLRWRHVDCGFHNPNSRKNPAERDSTQAMSGTRSAFTRWSRYPPHEHQVTIFPITIRPGSRGNPASSKPFDSHAAINGVLQIHRLRVQESRRVRVVVPTQLKRRRALVWTILYLARPGNPLSSARSRSSSPRPSRSGGPTTWAGERHGCRKRVEGSVRAGGHGSM